MPFKLILMFLFVILLYKIYIKKKREVLEAIVVYYRNTYKTKPCLLHLILQVICENG